MESPKPYASMAMHAAGAGAMMATTMKFVPAVAATKDVRLEATSQGLDIYVVTPPKAPTVVLSLMVVGLLVSLVAFAVSRFEGGGHPSGMPFVFLSPYFALFPIWAQRAKPTKRLRARISAIGWEWGVGSLSRTRIEPSDVRGVEIQTVFPRRFTADPTYRVRVHFQAGEFANRTATLVDGFPTASAARAFVGELERVYATSQAPGSGAPPLPLLQSRLHEVRIDVRSETVAAEWGWPASRLHADAGRLTWKRRFQPEHELDADELADVVAVPSMRRGSSDLVAKLKNGNLVIVLGAHDPPGLALHLAKDIRRVLRIPDPPALAARSPALPAKDDALLHGQR